MMPTFQQMTLFSDEVSSGLIEKNEREQFFEKYQDRSGYWISLGNSVVFINEDGSYDNLPNELLRPAKIMIMNNRRSTFSRNNNAKVYKDIPTAIRSAIQKLNNKKEGASSAIYIEYSDNPEALSYNSRVIGQTVVILKKGKESVDILKNTRYHFTNCNFLNYEDVKNIFNNNKIPDKWIPTKRINQDINSRIELLKIKYNVKTITFSSYMDNDTKITSLDQLTEIYINISKVFDVFLAPSVNIVFENIRSAIADYDATTKTIRLRVHGKSSYYHEFFHHIDLSLSSLTVLDKQDIIKNSYTDMIRSLKNEKTLKEKIDSLNQELIDFENKQEKQPKDYYEHNKLVEHYNYKLENIEITARFFNSYMYYFYSNSENKHYFYNYTVEEILNNKHFMETYLKRLQYISKNKLELAKELKAQKDMS